MKKGGSFQKEWFLFIFLIVNGGEGDFDPPSRAYATDDDNKNFIALSAQVLCFRSFSFFLFILINDFVCFFILVMTIKILLRCQLKVCVFVLFIFFFSFQ